jgi:phosphatidylserine/phosphatidylglycerophosphate/cardiolipin synthase-like enzyme
MIHGRTVRVRIVRCALMIPALGALGWGLANRETISAVATPAPTAAAPEGPAAVYFSRPQAFDGEYAGGPDEAVVAALDRARARVDIAVYDFDLLSVARALVRASRRGVAVRIVVDSDNWHTEAVDFLRTEGIPVAGDGREALMHDKFIVIDGGEVWAGSMNLTVNDAYRNDNNLIRLRSEALARIFSDEFEEMFQAKKFGPSSPGGKPAAAVETEAGAVEALFAPEDGVADRVIRLIGDARTSIHFLAFSFTSADIAQAMLERSAGGVSVSGVFETTQVHSNTGTQFDILRMAGAAVLLDANPRNMHHKVILIDGEIVIAGSYNFTNSAETKNDEDLLIIRNPELAAAYEREFERIRALAETAAPAGFIFLAPPHPRPQEFPAFFAVRIDRGI